MNLRFNHIQALARGIGSEGCERSPVPHSLLIERALLTWLRGLPREDHPLLRGAEPDYGLSRSLLAAATDLKEAGFPSDPSFVLERLRSIMGEDSDLTPLDVQKAGDVTLAHRFVDDKLRELGMADDSDFLASAADRAPSWLERNKIASILTYGFYDMTQRECDFLEALARHRTMVLFVPYDAPLASPPPPEWKFAATFAREFAARIARRHSHARVEAPCVETRLLAAAGEEDEVWQCAKLLLEFHEAGIPYEEMGVVARGLDAYADLIASTFEAHCIPRCMREGRRLGDEPLAQWAARLFRLALDEFPLRATLDVVLSPLIQSSTDRRNWEFLVRQLRILRGEDWRRLDRWAETGVTFRRGREGEAETRAYEVTGPEVRALAQAVDKLRDRLSRVPARSTWDAFAAEHAQLLDDVMGSGDLDEHEQSVLEEVRGILEQLRSLGALGERIGWEEFLEAFDRLLAERRLPGPAGKGVHVTDAMGARGLRWQVLVVLGLNARTFPRFLIEEPFLSDALRRGVVRTTGHRIAVRSDAYDEERLLFQLLLDSPTRHRILTYQYADSTGRWRDPSPYLRPFAGGGQNVRKVSRGIRERLDALAPGLRTGPETIQAAVLEGQPAGRVAKLLTAWGFEGEGFDRALAAVRAREGGAVSDFEGRVGPIPRPRLSPTRLESFFRCPFQFLAESVLRLHPYEDFEEGFDLEPLEVGALEHVLLERVYLRLQADGFKAASISRLVEEEMRAAEKAFEERYNVNLSGLLAARRALVIRTVIAFVQWDRTMNWEAWEPIRFEFPVSGELAGIPLGGKVDRMDRHRISGLLRLVDYKRRLSAQWETQLRRQITTLRKVQPVAYLETAPGEATEVAFLFLEAILKDEPQSARVLTADEWARARPAVEAALQKAVRALDEGWFPIRPDERGACGYCDYADACRKNDLSMRSKPARLRQPALFWDAVEPVDGKP